MNSFGSRLLAFVFVLSLSPAALAADVTATWDGTYITDPSQVPADFPANAPGPAPYPSYAKISLKVATNCAVAGVNDSTKITGWTPQPSAYGILQRDILSCVSDYEGCNLYNLFYAGRLYAEKDQGNASVTYDAYVRPGAAYVLTGTQVCYIDDNKGRRCGGNATEFPRCHGWRSPKVEIPPVLHSVTITSKKQYKNFNTFKAGATLSIEDYNFYDALPDKKSSFELPIQKTLIVEGPGIPQTEYDLTNWDMHDSIAVLTPTSAGTMRLKLRTRGYTYYYDHWHGNKDDDWNWYDWNKLYPNPTYTEQTLYSTNKLCDEIFDVHQLNDPSDDERCSGYGEPIYHAELFSLESEWLEIPVTDDWCLIKKEKRDPFYLVSAIPSEGCHSCSSKYSEERNLWDPDPCAASTEEDGDDPSEDDSSSGCSAAGAGFVSSGILFALFPALRRRCDPRKEKDRVLKQ